MLAVNLRVDNHFTSLVLHRSFLIYITLNPVSHQANQEIFFKSVNVGHKKHRVNTLPFYDV